jgi:hypothetical protein
MSLSKNAKRLAFAAIAALFCLSCSRAEVTGFPWKASGGEALPFSQTGGLPQGAEGSLDASHPGNRFVPRAVLAAGPNEALELEFNLGAPASGARLSLALSSRADGGQPFFQTELLLRDAKTRYAIPLAEKARVASVSVALLDPAAAGSAAANSGAVSIASISLVPLFRGIESLSGEIRLSPGLSVYKKGSEGRISVGSPFADMSDKDGKARVIVLSYGPGCAGFRLESGGSRLFSVRARAQGARVVLPASLFPADVERVELVYPAGEVMPDFYATVLDPRDAEFADLGRVLRSPASGADYDLYRWDLLPSVLIFDFRDYAAQDSYLKRLAFFVEKAGYKGKLADDGAIAGLHGWNAHDYRAEDLAAFFETARQTAFRLDPQEETLKKILLDRGILVEIGGSIRPGQGAIVSISRESQGYLRSLFLTHETSHAIFFTDPDYRAFVQKTWASIPPEEKWFWRVYFRWMEYDTSDSYLMANEFQAYLLQQPVALVEGYFTKNLAARLAEKHPELKEQIDAYMAKYGPSFEERAKTIESWLAAKYGFYAGRGNFIQ